MGYRFNSFLIGYFFGMHMIYVMPEHYYKNFKEKVVNDVENEYNQKDPNYFAVFGKGITGFVEFLIGEKSPYKDLLDYIEKRSKTEKK